MNTIEKYPEKLMAEALSKYSTPYGKPNPETYAYLAGASAMNGSAGVWVIDCSLPKEDGEYFCYVKHRNSFADDPLDRDNVEFKKGRWDMAPGWRVIRWLDESVSSPSPQINSAGVWRTDKPDKERDYRCHIKCDDRSDKPIETDIVDFKNGDWQTASGWTVVEWRDVSAASPSPQTTNNGLMEPKYISPDPTTYAKASAAKEPYIPGAASPSPLEAETADKKEGL